MVLVNEQTSRVLFAIPFCLAWTVAGLVLVRSSADDLPVPS